MEVVAVPVSAAAEETTACVLVWGWVGWRKGERVCECVGDGGKKEERKRERSSPFCRDELL